MAAWFVTNCKASNSREKYIQALRQHIAVDIYGPCGKHKCYDEEQCFKMLQQRYRFYLSFENSNCHEYISEKFWQNALQNNVIPVVFGASKLEYSRVAPPGSFIHVDDFPTPQHLARYLKVLSKDVKKYRKYFDWKKTVGAAVDVRFRPRLSKYWCDLCEALHDKRKPVSIHKYLDKWWTVDRQCNQLSEYDRSYGNY